MKTYPREIAARLVRAARSFSALILTGPRRAGKTHLLRAAFPRAGYQLLESPEVLDRVRDDPRGWLESLKPPVILDEIQNTPELFPWVRSFIDARPAKKGQWLITGSQDFSLMAHVTESMTGRAAIFHLLPLSLRELGKWNLLRGGFPEVWLKPSGASVWFASYLETYLERDVRQLIAVRDLVTFRRFLALLASRHGQVLNRSDMAAPLGVSVPTISHWLSALETTGQIALLPPYFESFGKRLVKSPKVYWLDSGLVCHLLGLDTPAELEKSPFLGAVFEGFVAAELIKNQINAGRRRELYYFRDERGLEVDFVEPRPGGYLRLIEAKWTRTVTPTLAYPLKRLLEAIGEGKTEAVVVHRGSKSAPPSAVVSRGVLALSVEQLLLEAPRPESATARPANG
ncbi:MAG: ATP-binding protein [Myxococcales bacterium]|nr:ATP-binding protein [Myxococcales bacterium]